MTTRLGPKQRELVDAMKDGAELLNGRGTWSLKREGWWRTVNRERCMGLYVRGFIMENGERYGRVIYALTEKGKAAV